LAELTRIKRKRAAEMAKKEVQKEQEEGRIRMENILTGNLLLQEWMQAVAAGTEKTEFKVIYSDDLSLKCMRYGFSNLD
jgi:hypothetical protein